MSAEKINQLFWLNYAQAIKDKAGANFGKSGVFFLASEAQKGPVAGSNIPDEYTQQGLYDIANNLLATDDLFYRPSALHGYAEALGTYLNWVDLGSAASSAMDTAYLNALQDQDAADVAYQKQSAKAKIQFTEDTTTGLLPTGMKMYEWVAAGNAPAFTAAKNERDAIAATVVNIQSQIAGPMAAKLTADRALLAKGLNTDFDFAGYVPSLN